MKTFLKVLFVIFLCVALALVIYYLTLYNNWPFIKGVYIYCIIIGILIIYLILQKLYLRYKEKLYIKKIIAQDSDKLGSLQIGNIRKTLEKSWYSSLNILTTSLLKTKRDPVHALPWFLVLGGKSSGKSTLLNNVTLNSSIKNELSVRENCSWHYFDNSIILNLTSKYLNKSYDLHISKEWDYLLVLMKKTRKKEPINGIIITISIDDLISKDEDILFRESLLVKKKVDEIISVFDAQIPIYIIVTKMNKIFGFSETQNYVLEKNTQSILGYTNDDYNNTDNINKNIDKSVNYISDNLKELIKELFFQKNKDLDKIIYFSKEFTLLSEKLTNYINSIFDDNLYQYLPKYRGLYLTGIISNDFSNLFSLKNELKNKEILNLSMPINISHINNLFKKVIPGDRNIFSFLKLDKQFYFRFFLTVLIALFVTGWFALSYKQNNEILNLVKNYQKAITVQNNFSANTLIMHQKFNYIEDIKALYEDSFFAKYGYRQSENFIGKIESAFNIDFNRVLLSDFDKDITKLVFSKNLNDEEYSIVIAYLLQNIKVHRDIMSNKDFIINDISYVNDIVNFKRIVTSDLINHNFLEIYYNFLVTTNDIQFIKDRHDLMEQYLETLLSKRSINLHWLISAPLIKKDDITLYNFWPNLNINPDLDKISINAAFTVEGKEKITKYIELLKEISFHNSAKLNYSITEFWDWYDDLFFDRWSFFLKNFNNTFDYYDYSVNRPMLLFSMFSNENAYKKVITYFAEQLKMYENRDIPKWAKEIISLERILKISIKIDNQEKNKNNTLIDDIRLKHEETQSKYASKNNEEYAKQYENAILLNNYFKSFTKLEFINNNLSEEISQFFSNDKSTSKLNNVYERLLKLQYSMKDYFGAFAYELIKGPFDFIVNYAINRESCLLNQKWNTEVVLPSKNIEKISLLNKLFADNGLVKNFIQNNLNHYITSDDGVIYERSLTNKLYKIPMTEQFLSFLTKGSSDNYVPKNEYLISIETKPMGINHESTILPFRNELRINCENEIFVLNNYNYKNQKDFIWEPKSCKSVIVTVFFENIIFEKRYEKKNSFLDFVDDIKNGNIRLTLNNLVTNKAIMKNNNLKWVDVHFNLSNYKELLKINNQNKLAIPKRIAQCK